MYAFTIEARDSLKLPSYLTLPKNITLDAKLQASKSVPMVLLVHGGPFGRDYYGFNPTHQWLANRGYAVLSVNFRASTGFGKDFVNRGDKEWSGKMHDDLIDAVDWAISKGIANKDKVAIMGRSYGGYATLVGLTYTPEVFCCGVDLVGISNLETLLKTIPPYWKSFLNDMIHRIGNPFTPKGIKFLKSCSPLYKANAITKPLLIGQGANDPRVKQDEAEQMVNAMKENNLPVIYALYPNEGHSWGNPGNELSFNALTENFLALHLDGQAEPIKDTFENSSIEIKEGKDMLTFL
jgi:dipeptidyl aminopeptidase/acylaminoacyl peptidase